MSILNNAPDNGTWGDNSDPFDPMEAVVTNSVDKFGPPNIQLVTYGAGSDTVKSILPFGY